MPEYQLEVALALAASAICSLAVSYFKARKKEGRIRLPTQIDEYNDESLPAHDPFDVTKAEDFVDGYSIEGVAFWNRVC